MHAAWIVGFSEGEEILAEEIGSDLVK